ESNITFNYVRALSDFITNFTFGRGVKFKTPQTTEAIVPNLLRRVWEVDNHKAKTLWSMGQLGSVSGDCPVKIAYEDPWVDPSGRVHNGRVRIIPLNPAHCFPEFHPHDRNRLIRFKLKYRFWGTSDDGTRQVFTYTEILTDSTIEEYVDDRLLDSRKNTIGTIPVVFIPNIPIEGSPWGLSDIHDITSLNREYNEKATDLSDIINYHAAPVTVITGAKANQLEKGPKKVWGNLPKDANVFNLDMTTNLSGPIAYMEMLKQAMHEMTGVPAGALGEKQAISNTSGVALAIQYQPLMNRFSLKTNQYGYGIERINEIILLTLAVKEPHAFQFNPYEESHLKPGQLPVLDPADPLTYQTTADFPPPLPTDVIIKLEELQRTMGLGLESKRGALRELGEEFPDERIAEIYEELREDIMSQGALDLLRTSIQVSISSALGIPLDPDGEGGGGSEDVASAGGSSVTHATGTPTGGGSGTPEGVLPGAGSGMPEVAIPLDPAELMNQLVTRAYGSKQAKRRGAPQRETS
ncbi:MAG: phage portal protein, partial [Actinomycetota bacterium]